MKQQASQSVIYNHIIEKSKLTKVHQQQLKANRGFCDDVITRLKFRSCGPEIGEIILQMRETVELQSLISAGVINSADTITPHLLDPEKILIPYLNQDGTVYYLKCHKRGNLPGVGLVPYSHMTYLNHYDDTSPKMMGAIIICESEFKAAAMWQLGFKAVGLSGIQSFSGKNMPMLETIVQQSKHLYIMFDREIQDDPTLQETFKDSPEKRYASLTWAYIQAYKMKDYFQVAYPDLEIRIAKLPKEWIPKGEGKIDCDKALALGINGDQMRVVLADSLEAEEFRRQLKNEVNPADIIAVDRRLQQAHKKSNVYESNNCYIRRIIKTVQVKKPTKDQPAVYENELVETTISNFTLKMMGLIYTRDALFRELRIKSTYASSDCVGTFDALELTSLEKFKTKLIKTGDFVFKGMQKDLDEILEQLSLEHPGAITRAITSVGRAEEYKTWVYKNLMIKDNETVIPYNATTNSFFDTETYTHWRLVNMNDSSEALPELCTKTEIKHAEIFEYMCRTWGFDVALQGFSFAISCLYSNPIFDKTQGFPMAFLFGERAAGKTSLSDIMAALLGMAYTMAPLNLTVSTENGITYKMANYGSLPIRMDEYREDYSMKKKQNMLRSLYNRQIGIKGTKVAYRTLEYKMNGCAILIGEEYPSDAALYSRCIPIHVKQKKTMETSIAISWLYDNIDKLSIITYNQLIHYKKNQERFMKYFEENKADFSRMAKSSFNPRALNHIAMMAAAFQIVFYDHKQLLNRAAASFLEQYQDNIKSQVASTVLNQFFEDVVLLLMLEPTIKSCGVILTTPHTRYGVFDLTLIHHKWKERIDRNNSISLSSYQTIINYIKAQSYYVTHNIEANVPSSELGSKCVVVDLNNSEVPEALLKFFSTSMERNFGVIKDEVAWEHALTRK